VGVARYRLITWQRSHERSSNSLLSIRPLVRALKHRAGQVVLFEQMPIVQDRALHNFIFHSIAKTELVQRFLSGTEDAVR
jgi:hypothetical protein